MAKIALILSGAVLVEALVQYGKEIIDMIENKQKKAVIIQSLTLVLGIGIAFLFQLHIFNALDIQVDTLTDTILTGIIISRGSNYANDLISKIRGENPEYEFLPIIETDPEQNQEPTE